MRAWRHSLHGRLVLLLLLALVVAQGVALTVMLIAQHRFVKELNEVIAIRRLPAAVQSLEGLSTAQRQGFATALSTPWSRFSIGASPTLSAPSGYPELTRQLADALNQSVEDIRIGSVPAPLPAAQPARAEQSARWSGETMRVEIRLGPQSWLRLERPLSPPLHHSVGPVALSLIFSALAVLAVVAWLARRITRPLGALTEAADRFGRGDPGPPLPESGPEDLRRTVRAFNAMSQRLQRFITDRTHLLAAISHDLRTPITALRLRTEMVDDLRARERMQRSLDEMQRMVEATLQFARAEAVQEATRAIDLGELVEDVCADVADAGGEVNCAAPAGITLLGRPTALSRALRNLVENAVFYGRRADVSVTSTGEAVRITIDDAGPGIPQADRERVFDPFVRLENSRSVDTGGIGLGLATARTIIHAHGGEVRLGESPMGGLRAEVTLPCADDFLPC